MSSLCWPIGPRVFLGKCVGQIKRKQICWKMLTRLDEKCDLSKCILVHPYGFETAGSHKLLSKAAQKNWCFSKSRSF